MFTGLVKDIGTVIGKYVKEDVYFKISTKFQYSNIEHGASICCSGICLTVISKGQEDGIYWFEACVSPETLEKTNAKYWKIGTAINLEKSLTLKDELGGHLVTGHIDTTSIIDDIILESSCRKYKFALEERFRPFIAPKGSVCINGISLTVNDVEKNNFWVTIIPHTYENTNLQFLAVGDVVNLEVDLMARYAYNILNVQKEVEHA